MPSDVRIFFVIVYTYMKYASNSSTQYQENTYIIAFIKSKRGMTGFNQSKVRKTYSVSKTPCIRIVYAKLVNVVLKLNYDKKEARNRS